MKKNILLSLTVHLFPLIMFGALIYCTEATSFRSFYLTHLDDITLGAGAIILSFMSMIILAISGYPKWQSYLATYVCMWSLTAMLLLTFITTAEGYASPQIPIINTICLTSLAGGYGLIVYHFNRDDSKKVE